MYRIEYYHDKHWLAADCQFCEIKSEYASESEAQKTINAQNDFEKSEGENQTSFRIVKA